MAQLSKTHYSIVISFVLLYTVACKTSRKAGTMESPTRSDTVTSVVVAGREDLLEKLLLQHPAYFDEIITHKEKYRVQIIYTQIDRDGNNQPSFTDFYYNVDENNYFYPASTVKMPTALLALQKLNELNITGLQRNTAMITGAAYSGQTPAYNDPTTPNGTPSIEQYIKKIFLVSDNDAFNRVYEFNGQQYINDRLQEMGYRYAAINHRLEIFLTQDENRHTNPVQFFDTTGNVIYEQPMLFNKKPYPQRNDLLGKGYYQRGVLINEPMNFSVKNRITLPELHEILRSVMFPSCTPPARRFNITANDYDFVRKCMSQLPSESNYPPYNSTYYDAYCKFLLLGGDKQAKLPAHVRIFNKVGDAYGFLLDIAYIADFENKVECMLSAVIYCNEDDILNDDIYDYKKTGFPFMKHLGEIIYQHELKRTRKYQPNLDEFKFSYGK